MGSGPRRVSPSTSSMTRAHLDTIDVGNVRMIERSQDLPFALEPSATLGILRYRSRQHLDRNFAFQPRVPSPVHLAHAARAEFRFHAIRTESLSRDKLRAHGIEQEICLLPCGAVQHHLARASLREQNFHGV